MSNNPLTPPINIGIAVFEHLLVTSLTLPIEMLRAGEALLKAIVIKITLNLWLFI